MSTILVYPSIEQALLGAGGTTLSVTFPSSQAVTNVNQDGAVVAPESNAPALNVVVAGLTNDSPGKTEELPLGADGRSVIIEGVAGGTTVPVSGTVTATGTNANQDPAYVAPESTTAVTKGVVTLGLTNDGTPAFEEIPLGADGRTVIVEGFTGGTAIPISGSITATVASTSANQGTGAAVTAAWPVAPGLPAGATDEDGATAAMTGTAATQVLAAISAKRHYITTIVVSNSSATATLVSITGLASTKTWTIPAPANTSGAVIPLPKPLVGATNTDLTATCVTTGSSTIVCTTGYNV